MRAALSFGRSKSTHDVEKNGKKTSKSRWIANMQAGINRFVWDFTEDALFIEVASGPLARSIKARKTGPTVVPGTLYRPPHAGRSNAGSNGRRQAGSALRPWTQAQYQAGYAFARKYSTAYGKIDEALNHMDAIKKSLAAAATTAKSNATLAAQIARRADEVERRLRRVHRGELSRNDEDSIQRGGSLRESVPRTGFGGLQWPPTAAQLDYGKRFDDAYDAAFASYNAFVSARFRSSTLSFKSAGLKPVERARKQSRLKRTGNAHQATRVIAAEGRV